MIRGARRESPAGETPARSSIGAGSSPARPGVALEVRLLGQPHVLVEGRSVEAFASARLLSLLAFLIVHRRSPVRRQRVAFSFWPDSTERQAHTNLRQALFNLRHALPEPERFLRVDGTVVQWREDAPAAVDLVDLEEAAERSNRVGDQASLERAATLYRGDLLPGWYEDWIEPERDRLRRDQVRRLERLAEWYEEHGDQSSAVRWAEQLVRFDPLHEAGYRRLMRLHLGLGERARALRAYHSCASALERELGVSPADETTELYERLVAIDAAASSFPPLSGGVSGPSLVGRDDEWQRLLSSLRSTEAGGAEFVLVTGEPGIGKTRLVDEFRGWCARRDIPTAVARAYQAEGSLPYAPITELLRSPALRPTLDRLDATWLREVARLLPELRTDTPDLTDPSSQVVGERSRLFEALARAFTSTSRPLTLIVDDLQWCDAETLEFLHYLVRFASTHRLLVIGTARDEAMQVERPLLTMTAGLRAIDAVVEIALARLDTADAIALARELVGTSSDDTTLHQLVDDAEGNPLFLVEMARSGLVIGSTSRAAADASRLPPKVHSVIQTRLDRLPAISRQLVGAAAVVGRDFDTDVIRRMLPELDDDLVVALDELWRRGIVLEQGQNAYDFSHDKIREVAYHSLGPARRRRLHQSAAEALASLHSGFLTPVAAQIAAHYDRAGSVDLAVEHYGRAIAAAQHMFAYDDVITLAGRGLELLESLPASPERGERELSLLVPFGVAMYAGHGVLGGYEDVYERVDSLRADLGLPPEPSAVRFGANAAIGRRKFQESDRLGRLLVTLAGERQDLLLITEGHYLRGVSNFWMGRFGEAREHLQRALETFQEEHADRHLEWFGQDPKAVCLLRLAWTEWHLGRFAEAAALRERALARADRLGHIFTLGYVRVFAAWAAADAGDARLVADLIHDLPGAELNVWLAVTRDILAGWAEARSGGAGVAVRTLAAAADNAAANQPLMEPLALLCLASAHEHAGDDADALRAVTRSREIAEHEMQFHDSDARRREGLLLHRCGADPAEVECALRDAVEIAHAQQGAVLELQARTSLTRWLRETDR
jgi:DNA-binding SARP family transcriptional activator